MKLEQIASSRLYENTEVNFQELYRDVLQKVSSLHRNDGSSRIVKSPEFEKTLNFKDLEYEVSISRVSLDQKNETYPGIIGSMSDMTVVCHSSHEQLSLDISEDNPFMPNLVLDGPTSVMVGFGRKTKLAEVNIQKLQEKIKDSSGKSIPISKIFVDDGFFHTQHSIGNLVFGGNSFPQLIFSGGASIENMDSVSVTEILDVTVSAKSKVDLRKINFIGSEAIVYLGQDILRSQWNMLADVMETWDASKVRLWTRKESAAFGEFNNWFICRIPSPIGLRILRVFKQKRYAEDAHSLISGFFPSRIVKELMDLSEDDLEMMGSSDLEEMYPDYFN